MTDHLFDVFGRLRDALCDHDVESQDEMLETINALVFIATALTNRARKSIPPEAFPRAANAHMNELQKHAHRLALKVNLKGERDKCRSFH